MRHKDQQYGQAFLTVSVCGGDGGDNGRQGAILGQGSAVTSSRELQGRRLAGRKETRGCGRQKQQLMNRIMYLFIDSYPSCTNAQLSL